MCDNCGCNITSGNAVLAARPGEDGRSAVTVLTDLLRANDHAAHHNREHFDRHGVLVINLMSSPGSGKTALLEATARALRGRLRMAVIEGDLETENDARRIREQGIPAVQIFTGSACHLDAHMVHDALHELPLADLDVLFIENVGNLVCPSGFDLGQHHNVVMLSVTEGDDKPAKYPVMFRGADLLLLGKMDLAAHFEDFDPQRAQRYLRELGNGARVVPISARTGDGFRVWLHWLEERLKSRREMMSESRHGFGAPVAG